MMQHSLPLGRMRCRRQRINSLEARRRALEGVDLDQLIESAARRGARLALAELGLEDARAPQDVRDLRNLLVNWRKIRKEAVNTVISLLVKALLIFMIAVLLVFFWVVGLRG